MRPSFGARAEPDAHELPRDCGVRVLGEAQEPVRSAVLSVGGRFWMRMRLGGHVRTMMLIAVVVLSGCGVEPADSIEDGSLGVAPMPWLSIQPGMKAAEVETKAGAPCQVLSQTWDPRETWVYRSAACASETAWCVFLDAGVVDRVVPHCENG